jgi:hypothetical protein
VEAGVKLVHAVIDQYPKSFQHINGARAYVKKVCQENGLKFQTVEGTAPKQLAMYVHYNTARQAYEAGEFDLLEKPDTPYKGKKWNTRQYTQIAPSSSIESSSAPTTAHSTGSSSGSNTTPPTITDGAKQLGSEQESRTENMSGIVAVKHVDIDLSPKMEEKKVNIDGQSMGSMKQAEVKIYTLIDLLEPRKIKLHTLIDLEQPEEESVVASDLAALIDIFSNNVMFKDEGFNVSAIHSFPICANHVGQELATEMQDGKLIW